MSHRFRLTAATAVVVVLLAALAHGAVHERASAQGTPSAGTFSNGLPSAGGFSLAVWGGGSADALSAGAAAQRCTLQSAWVTAGGEFVGFVPGAPALVNASFLAQFPGTIPAGTPLVVVCRAPQAPTATATATATQPTATATGTTSLVTPQEAELARLINAYRAANGLPAVPVSRSLTLVAQAHARDLETNRPDTGTDNRGLECNSHSWSANGNGLWTPVCYTPDHRYAEGMWSKPREITRGAYTGNGYENAFGSVGTQATAQAALDGWKSSPPHNEVILEQGIWAGKRWPAMGVGIFGGYAVLWFGDIPDPQGNIQ